jgi:hypothetical protein
MTMPEKQECAIDEGVWAAEQLGLSGGGPAARRAALAIQLQHHNFLPPADWQALARVAQARVAQAQRPPTVMTTTEGLLTGRRDVLRHEVEEFCTEFFRLNPAARRRRHAELVSACASHKPLLAHVNALAGGLNIECGSPGASESPEVDGLFNVMLELFVLRPHNRAIARHVFLQQIRPEPRKWATAARVLSQLAPEVARLDAVLFSRLLSWKQEKRELASAERRRNRAFARATKTPLFRWRRLICGALGAALMISVIATALTSNPERQRRARRSRPSYGSRRIPAHFPAHGEARPMPTGKSDRTFELEVDEHGHLRAKVPTGASEPEMSPRKKPRSDDVPRVFVLPLPGQ